MNVVAGLSRNDNFLNNYCFFNPLIINTMSNFAFTVIFNVSFSLLLLVNYFIIKPKFFPHTLPFRKFLVLFVVSMAVANVVMYFLLKWFDYINF